MKFFCHGQDLPSRVCLLSRQSPAARLAALWDRRQVRGMEKLHHQPEKDLWPLTSPEAQPLPPCHFVWVPGLPCPAPEADRASSAPAAPWGWEQPSSSRSAIASLLPLCHPLPYISKGNSEATAISGWIHVVQDICWLTSPFLFASDTAGW